MIVTCWLTLSDFGLLGTTAQRPNDALVMFNKIPWRKTCVLDIFAVEHARATADDLLELKLRADRSYEEESLIVRSILRVLSSASFDLINGILLRVFL